MKCICFLMHLIVLLFVKVSQMMLQVFGATLYPALNRGPPHSQTDLMVPASGHKAESSLSHLPLSFLS